RQGPSQHGEWKQSEWVTSSSSAGGYHYSSSRNGSAVDHGCIAYPNEQRIQLLGITEDVALMQNVPPITTSCLHRESTEETRFESMVTTTNSYQANINQKAFL
ncbi:Uncharacterized protein FKW44_019460, partial [Caligus rogercresseyi]